MEIPNILKEASCVYKLCIVITATLFAIAQYYENRQRKIIETAKKDIKDIDFSKWGTHSHIQEKRKQWEEILATKPIENNKPIILTLFILLLIYIGLMIVPFFFRSDAATFVRWFLGGSLVILLIIGLWLFFNIFRMNRQATDIEKTVDNLKDTAKTLEALKP